MPYRKEIFFKGGFYHVFNRGLNKQNVFFQREDYLRFLKRLSFYLESNVCRLHAYCLMPNHYHLLLEQFGEVSISEMLGRLQNSYGKYFSIKYQRKGRVFEGRFKAKKIDTDEYVVQLSKYIHRNPVKAGLVNSVIEYPWSSFQSYLSELRQAFLYEEFILAYFGGDLELSKLRYKEFVEKGMDELIVYKLGKDLIDE